MKLPPLRRVERAAVDRVVDRLARQLVVERLRLRVQEEVERRDRVLLLVAVARLGSRPAGAGVGGIVSAQSNTSAWLLSTCSASVCVLDAILTLTVDVARRDARDRAARSSFGLRDHVNDAVRDDVLDHVRPDAGRRVVGAGSSSACRSARGPRTGTRARSRTRRRAAVSLIVILPVASSVVMPEIVVRLALVVGGGALDVAREERLAAPVELDRALDRVRRSRSP